MKRIIGTIITSVFILVLLSGSTMPDVKDKPVDITITKGNLKINKVKFKFPWTSDMFFKALGKSDRIFNGANDIHTYDAKGIILYQKPSTNDVSDFNIYFDNNEKHSFSPEAVFTGSLIIDGVRIRKNMPLDELMNKLPQYEFKKSIIGSYRGEFNKLYFYFEYDDFGNEIEWISCGKKQ